MRPQVLAALNDVMGSKTGVSSRGFPYLPHDGWVLFRDSVPHLFRAGQDVLDAMAGRENRKEQADARSVIRQVVLTAAVTAPPDLWLVRNVLGTYKTLGILDRFLAGELISPARLDVSAGGPSWTADPHEAETDLSLLHARGYLDASGDAYRLAATARARDVFQRVQKAPGDDAGVASIWGRIFSGDTLTSDEPARLTELVRLSPFRDRDDGEATWVATLEEIELGSRLVPLILGLRIANKTKGASVGAALDFSDLPTSLAQSVTDVFTRAGALHHERTSELSEVGVRMLAKGPGPFGIIEAYHPYMTKLAAILKNGRHAAHVARGANVAASQDANRASFEKANDALDRFAADTGFRYAVFIEHAVGKGEATRQRCGRANGQSLRYFGADLEDDAIDAAVREQREGKLPANMVFLRHVDIGEPDALLAGLRSHGVESRDAVMLVGNGFHEVRNQTDEKMIAVFRAYATAGIVLLFTEESALSTDDLRETAWNTYHAGFRYVHEKSGQGLRPAEPRPPSRFTTALPTSWTECATRGGYARVDRYASRGRTIYPYPPADGHNPSISMNHFLIPNELADRLRINRG